MINLKSNGIKGILKITLAITVFAGIQTTVYGQDTEVKEEEKGKKEKKDSGKLDKADKKTAAVKYRRSSLHTMMIEDDKLPKKDLILGTFYNAPFPDKYNNHTLGEKSFKLAEYYMEAPVVEGEKKKKKVDYSYTIHKYLKDNKIANQAVAKWFNRSPEGAFDMNLIGERGAYDATTQDAATAASTARGSASLADAGEELIPNTFVIVGYSKFVSNEVAAKAVKDIAYSLVEGMEPDAFGRTFAEGAADKAYEKTKDGYSVWTTAYLYQLQWTDSMSAVFYQNMWMDKTSIDPAKKEAFDNTDMFNFKLLGFQKSQALITGAGKNAENEEMVIKSATLKSIRSVFIKLQKKFEAFRTKTPLVSVDPLGATVGMKEGLEGGEKYEVLMQQMDAEGKMTYKRKGVIKVDKKKVWDNRFNAGEVMLDENGEVMKPENDLKFTHFKGGKGYYPGMLLRQIN